MGRGITVAATILDFSAEGARVLLPEAIFPGTYCTLRSSLFPADVRGRVVWQHGCEIALQFKAPRRAKGAPPDSIGEV